MTEEESINVLADVIADKLISRLANIVTFPTPEDVERIRDHVSPNGVAFQNGRRSGILAACDVLRTHGFLDAVTTLEGYVNCTSVAIGTVSDS